MVKEIDNSLDLDSLVFNSKQGTIFHSSAWVNYSTRTFAKLGYYESNELLGCIIFEVDTSTKKGRLGSISPYLGIVIQDKASVKLKNQIEKELISYARKSYENITFFTSPSYDNLKNFLFEGFDAKLFYTNILDLKKEQDSIFSSFSKNLKRNIKKANLDGLKVVREYKLDNLMFLIQKTFQRQEIEIWFDIIEVKQCIENLLKEKYSAIFTTYFNKKPIGSVCIVWDKNSAYYLLGGYNYENKHHGAVSLSMWEAIKFSKNMNLSRFDFEGSRLQNIDNFFIQFGTNKHPFYQVLDFKDSITIY